MALNLRAYLQVGGVTTQHGLLGCVAASLKIMSCSSTRVQFHPSFHRAARGYAATSASLKKKTLGTAKGTRKDARTQPESPPRTAASRTHKKTTSSEMEHSKVQDNKLKSVNRMTEEEQTKELDRMLVMAQFMPTMDPWGQEVLDTLGGSLSFQ